MIPSSLPASALVSLCLLAACALDGGPTDTSGATAPDVSSESPAQLDMPSAAETGTVNNVVDGDTVDVEGVGRIRVIGIDTPEICVPCLVGVADRAVM